MSYSQTREDLAYYLGVPSASLDEDLVVDADEWVMSHPGQSLSMWVDAMAEIGAL